MLNIYLLWRKKVTSCSTVTTFLPRGSSRKLPSMNCFNQRKLTFFKSTNWTIVIPESLPGIRGACRCSFFLAHTHRSPNQAILDLERLRGRMEGVPLQKLRRNQLCFWLQTGEPHTTPRNVLQRTTHVHPQKFKQCRTTLLEQVRKSVTF